MNSRQVRIRLAPNGYEVLSIRWRIQNERKDHPGFKESQKGDPCVYCLAPSQTWEHITPKFLGGKDGWENIARACRECNLDRGIKPFLIYLTEKRRKADAKHLDCVKAYQA